jgi:uncharacterized protein Yka (UPF0111/DUF47 family)
MSLQRIIDWFLPREDHFYDYLERLSEVAQTAVPVLGRFVEPGADYEQIRSEMTRLEKDGDKIVDEMLDALSNTMVTLIDREDLQ